MLLIAHRGNSVDYPENTIEAFNSAVELGADGIEMDVQVQNGEAVIVHDYVRPSQGNFPKFTDVLKQFKDRTQLEVEIKSFRVEEVTIITDILCQYNPPNLEVTSSIHLILPHVRKMLPDVTIGAIFPDKFIEDWMTEEFIVKLLDGHMRLAKANIVHVPPSLYSKKVIAALKKTYTIHHHIKTAEKKEYDRLVALGVERATFDDSRLLKKLNNPEIT